MLHSATEVECEAQLVGGGIEALSRRYSTLTTTVKSLRKGGMGF